MMMKGEGDLWWGSTCQPCNNRQYFLGLKKGVKVRVKNIRSGVVCGIQSDNRALESGETLKLCQVL